MGVASSDRLGCTCIEVPNVPCTCGSWPWLELDAATVDELQSLPFAAKPRPTDWPLRRREAPTKNRPELPCSVTWLARSATVGMHSQDKRERYNLTGLLHWSADLRKWKHCIWRLAVEERE